VNFHNIIIFWKESTRNQYKIRKPEPQAAISVSIGDLDLKVY